MNTKQSSTEPVCNLFLKAPSNKIHIAISSTPLGGKSSLIKRILLETQSYTNYNSKLKTNHSKKTSAESSPLYSFYSAKKEFSIVDYISNLEEHTLNIINASSNASLAIVLIDITQGILSQTRQESIILSILGVKKVILVINKIDLADYSQELFKQLESEYNSFAKNLNFEQTHAIPVSATKGDNISFKSTQTNWYKGSTLLDYLNTIDHLPNQYQQPLRFPIQSINPLKPDELCGYLISAKPTLEQEVRILPSGDIAHLKSVSFTQPDVKKHQKSRTATITLNKAVNASEGDLIVPIDEPCEISDQFEIKLIWVGMKPGFLGRSYLVKIGTKTLNAQITDIKHKINVNSFEELSASKIEMNDLNTIKIKTDQAIPFEAFETSKELGGITFSDKTTKRVIAVGMIRHSLRRANNIHQQKLDVNKLSRQRLNGHASKVIWFTGLSGSGKSTIANALEKELHTQNIKTYILDGDNIRHGLNKDLGFTDADRVENIRRVSEVAKLMVDAGIVVLTAFISPFRAERQMAREMFAENEFIEAYVDTPLEIAEARDPKGLYKKARLGKIPNFTGISSPYEPPLKPDLHIHTDKQDIDKIILNLTKTLNLKT